MIRHKSSIVSLNPSPSYVEKTQRSEKKDSQYGISSLKVKDYNPDNSYEDAYVAKMSYVSQVTENDKDVSRQMTNPFKKENKKAMQDYQMTKLTPAVNKGVKEMYDLEIEKLEMERLGRNQTEVRKSKNMLKATDDSETNVADPN